MEEENVLSPEEQIKALERENRRLKREVSRLNVAIMHEKLAYTTTLNQQKAATFIQRERERYLALLLANSPSIVLFLNHVGRRIDFCTDYFINKIGYKSAADVLGRTLTEVLSPHMTGKNLDELLESVKYVDENNISSAYDVHMTFESESADFAGLLVPMKDENQGGNGVMIMLYDVTDLKRSREEALAASRAKSAFLSNMSHEIRTPMNAIIGMTAIGRKANTLQSKDEALTKIEIASDHLLGIINDILDLSKIESGKMELSLIDFNFSQMIDRILSVINIRIQDKKQKFLVDIDPNIPDFLYGDDQRLAQVITNLLSNASKFTDEHGDISFKVNLVEKCECKCCILISVSDSGIGMDDEELSKLFTIFQQADAGTSRKFGGSGLGLAISKRLLELMNSEIRVKSKKGQGSEFAFTVNLTISDVSKITDGDMQTDIQISDFEGAFTGKTVLIVDDMEINLEIISALLGVTDMEIVVATNGKEAVNLFQKKPEIYDLILMDIQMPEIDGFTATKMIRELDIIEASTIPIVAMTANVFKEDIEKCLNAGMNGHLGKPIELDEVMRVLMEYMG